MFLQEFIRGMQNLDRQDVDKILAEGMSCQALRHEPGRAVWNIEQDLTDVNLDRHRHSYSDFGAVSPYISTTAGTYREYVNKTSDGVVYGYNRSMFAFDMALNFAVLMAQSDGWIFYGYHFLLGRPAGRHAEFAEEVRDFHQHPQWSQFRGEGELAAAIRIPPRRLRRAEFYRYHDVVTSIDNRNPVEPSVDGVIDNPAYIDPAVLLAPRGVI